MTKNIGHSALWIHREHSNVTQTLAILIVKLETNAEF